MPTKKPKGKEVKVKAWAMFDLTCGDLFKCPTFPLAFPDKKLANSWKKPVTCKIAIIPVTIRYSLPHSPKKKSNKKSHD